MAKTIRLSVVAPDRSVVDEPILSAVLPGTAGYFGILPDHEPFIATLRPGLIEYVVEGQKKHFVSIGGGFAEVSAQRTTVLADDALRATEIDIAREQAALDSARKALRGEDSKMTSEEAVLEMEKAMARIKAAKIAN